MTTTTLSGPSSDARAIYTAIEHRTAHITAQLRFAVRVLLKLPEPPQSLPIALNDLEAQAQHWALFVPDDADTRAQIAQHVVERFEFARSAAPQITQVLGLNTPEVLSAFERLCGAPFDTVERLPADTVPDTPLEDDVLDNQLGAEMEWVFLGRGDVLFEQGAPGDSLYVVANGRLRIVVDGTAVMELSVGDTVGEMGLISGEPRSATVYAARDSELCRLSKEGFERLSARYNLVMVQIALQMFDRVRRMSSAVRGFSKPLMITILPLSSAVPVNVFTERLAAALGDSVLHLSRERLDALLPDGLHYDPDAPLERFELSAWMNEQEARYRFILLEAEATPTGWTQRCLHHADRVLLLGNATESPQLTDSERLLGNNPRIMPRTELVLLREPGTQPKGTRAWLVGRKLERHYHVVVDYLADYARLARFLQGKARALVLGGGGTRAAAHIGVVWALEEAGIAIDLVGGTSAGSIIAGMVAMGWDFNTISEASRTHLLARGALLDYTLPLVSFTAGRRVSHAMKRLFGDVVIEDLPLPFFCVSGNLSKAQMAVHRHGLLRHALRASTAIPGVYPPMADEDGDLLVDGSVFNNLPADIAKTLCDGGVVIAVDIATGLGLAQQPYKLDEYLSGWRILWNRLNPFAAKTHVPNILGILARTTILSSASTRASRNAHADLLLTPPVDQFGLFELEASVQMAEAAYAYTRERLVAWDKRPI